MFFNLALVPDRTSIECPYFANAERWQPSSNKRSLFNNKKDLPEFKFFEKAGKRVFFEWYRKQPRKCGYCGIEESKLEKIFAKEHGIINTKRGRGQSLALERLNSESNESNETNCILACYICNNHKSDLISEEDFREFFNQNIRNYLESKFIKLRQSD